MSSNTLREAVSASGRALHTGADTTVELVPAEPGTGIRFDRSDPPYEGSVWARVHAVGATERRTAIGRGDTEIQTVEHLLAALAAMQVDDVVIRIDGPEPPMLDGSFTPWVELIDRSGVVPHDGEPAVIRVSESFEVRSGDARYVVSPSEGLTIAATIEWPHPVIGKQSLELAVTPDSFRREIAPARTFGFVHEVEALRARGLLQGATGEMAVVLSDNGIESGSLRWPDEFVRHKIGDVVGDLALLGARVEAHIMAEKPSHQGNVAVATEIARKGDRKDPTALDIGRIMEVMPHRYPLLLVDRILEIDPSGERIVGLKNVSINEPFFQGHFPGHPIMPGVLIVEAMAQTGGMLLMDQVENPETQVVYFMAIDRVKFRKPVTPGDQLRFEVEMLQFRRRTAKMRGVAFVDGQAVCEAEMMARVVDR